MEIGRLRALVAVVDRGTFDAAARALGVTPSAVSQRIRALEQGVGQVLVRRSTPCVATEAGETVIGAARQILLVEQETLSRLGASQHEHTTLSLAVNADSLATWFTDVLHAASAWSDVTLSLHVDDEDHTARLLREGTVVGAVTTWSKPVAGCRLERLGSMRYLPVVLADRLHEVELASFPMVRFNEKDDKQLAALRAAGVRSQVPMTEVPSSQGFAEAVRAGLGWGMLPEAQVGDDLKDGLLAAVPRLRPVDVELHWQRWKIESPLLDRVGDAVRRAAAGLRR